MADRRSATKIMRLDRYLAEMGIGSRSAVKEMIRKKQVCVNGIVVCRPEQKVCPGKDCITVSGRQVDFVSKEYFMLYKPAGVVSAVKDGKDRTVLDLITKHSRSDLFPVGRLDKDTEGLLLITNDGALSHELLSPKKHVDKVYYARISGAVTDEDVKCFQSGLDIGDEKRTLPAQLSVIKSGEISEVEITIREGRFHQIKRMFEAVNKRVLYLKRLSMGTLTLDETLRPGEYRALTSDETERLVKTHVKE
ncbi:rRNA pseudouridine synthase [Ruminococcus sp. OA3]|uniref:pseudouridine synthase n=1 Tax=Ruminococcus sp. OA3 TaxID=2914164 RepID=UPI001F06E01D|nr:pseudouridine synthase [Ruminococcus sp. OA3]MCH1983542.1 rRNA pseudouridine synthase [Ruminococcus sp. OA3]